MKQISGKEFCKILENNGWYLKRINGSHFIYCKEKSIVRISVPVHTNIPLKIGLLKALMKLADLDDKDITK
jgi:predicted RNA binding protein YcfA (HicA-like mRNA interferase family)